MWRPEPGQRGIMGGAEQLPLFDSPVSGMVLAPHQGAQQECNRPDQLRQCRDHCYSVGVFNCLCIRLLFERIDA